MLGFPRRILFENVPAFFLGFVNYLSVSKVKNNWFGDSWTRPKNLKIMKLWAFRFSQSEIDKLLVQDEAK